MSASRDRAEKVQRRCHLHTPATGSFPRWQSTRELGRFLLVAQALNGSNYCSLALLIEEKQVSSTFTSANPWTDAFASLEAKETSRAFGREASSAVTMRHLRGSAGHFKPVGHSERPLRRAGQHPQHHQPIASAASSESASKGLPPSPLWRAVLQPSEKLSDKKTHALS